MQELSNQITQGDGDSSYNLKEIKTFAHLDQIFKIASGTYYRATKLTSPQVRNEITILYAFVRIADDFVDEMPPDSNAFYLYKQCFFKEYSNYGSYYNNSKTEWISTLNVDYRYKYPIEEFIKLAYKREFKLEWITSFFDAMESDLLAREYYDLKETETYMYGSAEVIGLFLLKIFKISEDVMEKSEKHAKSLGQAFQYINFIRDFVWDINSLCRVYIPIAEIAKYPKLLLAYKENKQNLGNKEYIINNSLENDFSSFLKDQIIIYNQYYKNAIEGIYTLPKRLAIPVLTATNGYNYASTIITANPMIIFDRKIKPKRATMIKIAIQSIYQIFNKKLFKNSK